jgi:hypothetical protein
MSSLQRVEELIAQIDAAADPNVKAAARDLVQTLMEFHGDAVARMLELADDTAVQAMGRDETVRPLMLLYGLHPESTEIRVRRAVDRIRNAQFVGVEGPEVKIRVTGNGHAPSREAIEAAIQEAAPEVQSVLIEGVKPADFVSVEALLSA